MPLPELRMIFSDTYLSEAEIDFSKIQRNFQKLEFFDETFMNMQVMNISMVDGFITDLEYKLLREYHRLEKTPMQEAMFVSAQSQMWIFAVYELLRTWHSRIKKLITLYENGGLDSFVNAFPQDSLNLAHRQQVDAAKKLKADRSYLEVLKKNLEEMEVPYQYVRDLRVTLAKHEVPNKSNRVAINPGYGRINGYCGSLDYFVLHKEGYEYRINRRIIADLLRADLNI